MNKEIYPCLWFNSNAKEAVTYYCSIFKNAAITSENPVVVSFTLNGKKFIAINGGIDFPYTEAVSFVIECDTQEEIDHYWDKLTADGGKESMCGWCKDKYGVSWQVVPSILLKLMNDPAKTQRVMSAFMKMKKFDIKTLEEA